MFLLSLKLVTLNESQSYYNWYDMAEFSDVD